MMYMTFSLSLSLTFQNPTEKWALDDRSLCKIALVTEIISLTSTLHCFMSGIQMRWHCILCLECNIPV